MFQQLKNLFARKKGPGLSAGTAQAFRRALVGARRCRGFLRSGTSVKIVGNHAHSGKWGVIRGVRRMAGGGPRLYRVLIGGVETLVYQSWVRV